MLLMYALADRLGKTVGELVGTMSACEREGWLAYLHRENQFRRAAQR